jgi:hypothetical protein
LFQANFVTRRKTAFFPVARATAGRKTFLILKKDFENSRVREIAEAWWSYALISRKMLVELHNFRASYG